LDAGGVAVGARELSSTAPDCKELSASVALAIAISLDPARAVSAPPPADAAPESAPAPPFYTVAPSPQPGPLRHVAETRPVRTSAGIDVHGAIGSAPAPALGLGLRGDVRFGRVELGLEGRADLPASTRAAHGGDVSAQPIFATFATGVDVGGFVGCALGSGGVLLGSAASAPAGGRAATPFAGAGLRAAFDVRVSPRLTLRPYIEAEAALARTRLVYAGREAWRAPPGFASGGVAVRVALF
jgi:hypothetical protein